MKTKRLVVCVLMCLFLTFGTFATGVPVADPDVEIAGGRKILELDIIDFEGHNPERPSLYEKEMLKKWGIKFNYDDVPGGNEGEQKMNLLFASGSEPHVVTHCHFGKDAKTRWGIEGYLVAFSDYLNRVPNYRAMWDTQEDWDFMYANCKASDGKLYYLPFKSQTAGMLAWIYRKGTFDKWGLEFPKNPDELYNLCKTIKKRDSQAIPITGRNGLHWWMYGYETAFRTSGGGLTRDRIFFIDPDTNKLTYGPQTDKYRDCLEFMSKLYAEDLMEMEFLTLTTQQWTERYAQGLPYIQFSYGTRARWANTTMKDADPEAGWDWSRDWIDAYGKRPLAVRDAQFFHSGPIITKRCTQEQIDRLLEYFNWACTAEGIAFSNFGVEGITFNYVNGVPVFTDLIKTLDNPDGKHVIQWGFASIYFIIRHPEAIRTQQGEMFLDVGKAIEKQDYIKSIAWELTEEQDKELVNLETVLNDVRDEYITKFILGKMDVNDDAVWQQFQDDLKKAGLERARAIREAALKVSSIN